MPQHVRMYRELHLGPSPDPTERAVSISSSASSLSVTSSAWPTKVRRNFIFCLLHFNFAHED
jgi:hypothetical protein